MPVFARSHPQDLQVTRIGLRGSFGTLAVEQQWLSRTDIPATAAFHAPLKHRLEHAMPAHTLSWTSPSHAGWSVGAAYAHGSRHWLYDTPGEGRIYGAVSYRQGSLSLSGASNGARDWNLLGSYTEGRNTWRLMLARFEGEGEPMLQFGLDHRYSRALTFFAAVHHDDDGAALTDLRRRHSGTDSGIRSGRGIMTGLRYDF